jgi:hypothetical protein
MVPYACNSFILSVCSLFFIFIKNINRAIKRASEASTGDFTESTFEVYGFGGASLVINCLSDNANRCSSDVKMTVNKRNGKIAESGSVLFMYDRKGMIEVPVVLDEEALLDVAIEAGIDDFELFPVRDVCRLGRVCHVGRLASLFMYLPLNPFSLGRRGGNKYCVHGPYRCGCHGRGCQGHGTFGQNVLDLCLQGSCRVYRRGL